MEIRQLPLSPNGLTQRQDASERPARRETESRLARSEEIAAPDLRERERQSEQLRKVALARESERNDFRSRQADEESLPLRTRQALQTFRDNAPSAEERLGIELAGIDTFA